MKKEVTLKLFLELADSFREICRGIDIDECLRGECPFAKKDKYVDSICIFEDKGMQEPINWKVGGEEE